MKTTENPSKRTWNRQNVYETVKTRDELNAARPLSEPLVVSE